MIPLFSATKIRPSAANSMLVGLANPLKTTDSVNPEGRASASTFAVVVELEQLGEDPPFSANNPGGHSGLGGSWATTATSAPTGRTPRTRTAPTMAAIARRR